MINHYDQKQLEEEGVCLAYSFNKGGQGRTQGRNLEAGIEAETKEESCLQACFPWLPSLLCYTLQDLLPRGGSAHSGWALPYQSLCSPGLPRGQYLEAFPQLWFSLLKRL